LTYFWTDCPNCHCHVAINTTAYPDKLSGSLRRWSRNGSINDGRSFEIASGALAPDGGFTVACVCGQVLDVPGNLESRESRVASRVS
jgi:hypothetical protein